MSNTKKIKGNSAGSSPETRALSWETRVKQAREQREKILSQTKQNNTPHPKPKQNKSAQNNSKQSKVEPPAETAEVSPQTPPVFKSIYSAGVKEAVVAPEESRKNRKSRFGSVLAVISAVVFGFYLYLDGGGYLDELRFSGQKVPELSSTAAVEPLPEYGAAPSLMTELPTGVRQWGQDLEFPSGNYATPVSLSFRGVTIQPGFGQPVTLSEPGNGEIPSVLQLGKDVTSSAERPQAQELEQSKADVIDSTPPTVGQPTSAQRSFLNTVSLEPNFSSPGLVVAPVLEDHLSASQSIQRTLKPPILAGAPEFFGDLLPSYDPQPPVPSPLAPEIETKTKPPDSPLLPITASISLFVPTRVSEEATKKAVEILTQRKSQVAASARVNYSVRQTQVRYYHSADAASAALAAEALGGISRDFTGSTSKTQPGRIEIYLAGTGSGQSRRTNSGANNFEAFLNRLLQELR